MQEGALTIDSAEKEKQKRNSAVYDSVHENLFFMANLSGRPDVYVDSGFLLHYDGASLKNRPALIGRLIFPMEE